MLVSERDKTLGRGLAPGMSWGGGMLLTVVLLFSSHVAGTARPNPFGMPGMVPPYVPPQMLNIPQTSLQAKPTVRHPWRPVGLWALEVTF